MLPRRRWQEMTTVDFSDSDTSNWIATLPVAAIEQHGPHLPVCTDTCIAEGMVAGAIGALPAELPVTFLPVQAVGKSNEHIAFPGTITSAWDTVTRFWLDIGDSVARAGIRKLVIINSHGGNVPMIDIVARELRVRHGMLVSGTAWSRFGHPEGVIPESEGAYGIHGGDMETSVMLHFRPELVRMDKAVDSRSSQLEYARKFKHLRAHGLFPFGWRADDLNPAGTVGDASAATAEKGAAIVAHQVKGFVELCADINDFSLGDLAD